MLRVIGTKQLNKMVDYKNGKWEFYRGVDYRNVESVKKELEELGKEYKHYLTTTAIKGLYEDTIIVKK